MSQSAKANILKESDKRINLKSNKKHMSGALIDNIYFWIFSLPAVLYFAIFHYLPMLGIIIGFKNYKYSEGILGSKWVGFKNFEFFFGSQDVWNLLRNTIGYGLLFMIIGVITSVSVALLLFEIKNKYAIKTYQTIMILPTFISWVIVGYITYIVLDPRLGLMTQMLEAFNLKPIDWYTEPKYWPFILTIVNVWKGVGMSCIMYYAALLGVDTSLYEAASIDGASKGQQVWHISLPALIPLMIVLSILSIGNILKGDFGLFYQITGDVGVLYPATDIIDTYVYRGLRTGDLSVTTAIGVFQSFAGLMLVLITNSIVKKISPENSMF